jgi:hypothetical protein
MNAFEDASSSHEVPAQLAELYVFTSSDVGQALAEVAIHELLVDATADALVSVVVSRSLLVAT